MNFFFYIARQCDNAMDIHTYLLLLNMKVSTSMHFCHFIIKTEGRVVRQTNKKNRGYKFPCLE